MVEISDEMHEELRLILEGQNGRVYTLEEAKEISDGMLDFFGLLMDLYTEEYENECTLSYLDSVLMAVRTNDART
jgi:hypothetical protein